MSQFPCFALKDKELWPIINVNDISTQSYEFQCIVPKDIALQRQSQLDLICCISVRKILPRLTKDALLSILPYVSNDNYYDTLTRASILTNLEQVLSNKPIDELYSVFKLRKGKTCFPKRQDHLRVIQETTYVPAVQRNTHETNMNPNSGDQLNINDPFPPPPITEETQHRIISNYCKDMDTANFHESGCAVCGALTLIHLSVSTKELSFEYLKEFAESITWKERKDVTDPVQPVDGPVIDQKCKIVCQDCAESVRRRKLPKKALANGLWLGEVPKELSDLTFAEQLLIARVRINRFAVKVESGMHKTKCNIIAFQNPVPQIYDTLPPPTSDIEETFAVMFIRSKPPAEKDFDEVPVYNVRRTKVQEALEWLKLNHVDYENVFISHENLKNYPLNGCPVPVILLKPEDVLTNKQPESTSVNDTEQEEGVTDGPFVAIMHSLTDTGAPVKTWTKLAGDALSHLKNGEKLLILGHTDAAESLFKNPTLYSSAFPWLFPYGLGSIDNDKRKIKISAKLHKGHLLMYHDKRFQMDRLFSLFAFNHEQIKDSTTAGFILTKQSCFQDVCNRISNLDHKVLQDITERYGKEEAVKAETAEEKNCFRLLNDLDKVAEKVDGSFTSKKHMRNELWSLVSYKGAPSWFITFAPADNFHPLCLYYADTEEQFIPRFRTSSDRYRLIAQNPVAGARFFHTMVQLFLKHVLGVDTEQAGVFGKPSAYYGTVEQQGRLTLHLHMLVWIVNSLSPQEIRNRIMDPTSDFQKKMIDYLESAHTAEYVDSELEIVREEINDREVVPGYIKPTELLPSIPPEFCKCMLDSCVNCKQYQDRKNDYKTTLNDIIFRVNKHKCSKSNCRTNKFNMCKSRFPRQTFESSMIDPLTGAICMKQKESMLNTFNPIMPFLQRCNSDATSLLSGTAIKSTISYVTDYITKCSLNTHVIFESVRTIFEKFPELKGDAEGAANKSRRLLTKLCNSLVTKLEIGAPMASMYLLGNPDHYTSHSFVNFYWRSFVNEVMRTASTDEEVINDIPEKLVIITKGLRASSPIYDYMYRPLKYSDMALYDWIQQSTKGKGGTQRISKILKDLSDPDFDTDHDGYDSDIPQEQANIGGKRKRSTEEGEDTLVDYSEMFVNGHPQRQTHQPTLLKYDEYKDRVPNFIGGALPRRDKGDAEIYAAAMLTVFKPWRNGMDLKPELQNWSEALHNHKFSDKFIQLMDNFNLRYECSDARDDFAAQRKLTAGQGINNGNLPFDNDECDDLETQNMDSEAMELAKKEGWNEEEEEYDESFAVFGQRASAQLMKMNAIETLLHRLGWTKPKPILDHPNPNTLNSIDHSLDWSSTLKDKKEEILASRTDTYTKNSLQSDKKAPLTGKALEYAKAYLNQMKNLVRWKDINYLLKTYSKDQREIVQLKTSITTSFSLNKEQERAFKLITNHATSNTSQRLQMYLGGMAGTGKSQVLKAVTKFFEDIGQSGQIVLLAPTGSAAALIGGSTYHSYLGIMEK